METILATIWSDLDQILHKPTIKSVNKYYTCTSCNEQKVVTREGMVCTGCGLVDSIFIDDTAEWTSGVTEDGRVADPSRCNMKKKIGVTCSLFFMSLCGNPLKNDNINQQVSCMLPVA